MVSSDRSDEEKSSRTARTGSRVKKAATAVKGKPLVIVESKAKAKTVGRYLGRGYNVKACLGHVRDLPKTSLGIDLDHDFKPNYVTNSERRDIIEDIKKASKTASEILLATDPDREGEAIAWHLNYIIKRPEVTKRVEFNEITKGAVRAAIEHPRDIDEERVNAQQARRVLDRLVGYNLSPFLWRELQSGLSAGRVQSVAAKLICDREDEIEAFVPVEYWTIDGIFHKLDSNQALGVSFQARLAKIGDSPAEVPDQKNAEEILAELATSDYRIGNVTVKSIQKRALPPFITSTLQQEASKRLGFSARRTMALAQQLYEGISLGGGGEEGLITYMRTDSVRLSNEAIQEAREFIRETFGAEYLPDAPNLYKSKRKVQDAHEAIRPTVPARSPDSIKGHLEPDQAKLYRLIWERFIACQMVPGRDEQTQVEVVGGRFTFRASHTKRVFDGHRRVYNSLNGDENGGELPPLETGEEVRASEFLPEQHFTKPPPRYTTASLIKTLEELGIGRPSTYAPIISTIVDRKYVVREGQSFKPTELGRKVNHLLVEKFSDIIDSGFTARMEDNLDAIQAGSKDWVESIREFYEPFRADLKKALNMECPKCGGEIAIRNGRFGAFFACTHYPECDWRSSISPKGPAEEPEVLDEECPTCGQKLVVKHGRYGKFVACVGFPKCRYTRSIPEEGEAKAPAQTQGNEEGEAPAKREITYSKDPCPKCGNKMVLRRSRAGRFWGCEKYPECDGIRPFTIGIPCPRGCGGEYVERRSKRGKVFYGCTNYPECTETTWTYPGKKAQDAAKTATDSETDSGSENAEKAETAE
jgi:DNA topoisomerase-1